MSMYRVSSRSLHVELANAGLVPPHCRSIDIQIKTDGALVLVYEVFLDYAQLGALGRAFVEVAARELAQEHQP